MPKKYLSLLLLAPAAWLMACVPGVQAADTPVALSLSPAISEIPISRGQSVDREIKLVNQASTPMAVRVYAQNFEASDPYGGLKFNTDSTKQYSSSSWIKLKNPNLVLDPGARAAVTFTIKCPPDAEPGGHYSVIFFEPMSPSGVGDSSKIGVSQRVGALQFITVKGGNIEQGQVLGASESATCKGLACSFKTAGLREWGPIPFTFSFENTGNVHVKVNGKIEIFNFFGHKLAEIPIAEKTVLPGSARAFEAKWLREVLFGGYRAKLTLVYGAQRSTQTAELGFWVLPWRAMLAGGLICVIGGGALYLIKRKRRT